MIREPLQIIAALVGLSMSCGALADGAMRAVPPNVAFSEHGLDKISGFFSS